MKTSAGSRALYPLIPILIILTCLALPLSGARAGVRLISSDPAGVTLEFTPERVRVDTVQAGGARYSRVRILDGALVDAPGEPELPGLATLLGIPRTGTPRLTVLSSDGYELAALPPQPMAAGTMMDDPQGLPEQTVTRTPSAGAYSRAGLWPAVTGALGPEAGMRFQRVQSLGVRPVRYDASRGVLWVARRIVVRVDFGAGAGAPGASGRVADEGAAEESLYRGSILNYDQARAFRLGRPAATSRAARARARGADNGFPDFKLRVDSTGIFKVSYAQLQARFGPAALPAIPVGDLRCWVKYSGSAALAPLRDCEVPIRVVDTDVNGAFDGDDYFVVFALNLPARHPEARWFDPDSSSRFYTEAEVYWVGSRSGAANARMAERGASLGLGATTTPVSFRFTSRREEHWVPSLSTNTLEQNLYHATDQFDDDTTMTFRVLDIDAARPIGFRLQFRGGSDNTFPEYFGEHHIWAEVLHPQGTGTGVEPIFTNRVFLGRGLDTYDSKADPGFTLDGTHLSTRRNVLHLVGKHPQYPGGPLLNQAFAYLEWFEVSYYRQYLAQSVVGQLPFNSGDTLGALDLSVRRFREPTIEVYDISDSLHPRYIDVSSTVSGSGTNYQASFQDTTASRAHEYFAASRNYLPVLADGKISPDTASDLLATAGADLLIITHESLEAQAEPLAAEHRRQGLSVEVARIGDVYDELDGGRKSDIAIKRLLRHAFYEWSPAPRYVLLFGESSENPQHFLTSLQPKNGGARDQSHRDLVPSPHLFGSVAVDDPEIIPEDHFYVVGLDTTETVPIFPAMGIGRITASSPAAAQDAVDKIVLYHQPSANDSWRARNLYIADDTWSNGIGFGANTVQRNEGTEIHFRLISQQLYQIVENEGGFSYFGKDSFYVHEYTDTVHVCDDPNNPSLRGFQCMADYGHDHIGPKLWAKLSQGWLIANYQGHANAQLWGHEHTFVNWGGTVDVHNVENIDRPFLLNAYGCHVNRYDLYFEGSSQFGDGEGERIVMEPRKGAIGSFASTGYEWLPLTRGLDDIDLNFEEFRSFFVRPPTPDIGGDRGVKWILGDVLRDAKNHFLLRVMGVPPATQPNYGNVFWCGYACPPPGRYWINNNPYEVYSYCLLGDPALRMNPGPANFELAQDGQPVDTWGYLRGAASGAAADSVTLTAEIASPVGQDSLWLEERGAFGTRVVPRSAFTVTSIGDTAATYARRFHVAYRTVPAFRDYSVDFKARNVEGTVSTSSLHRVLAASAITSDQGPVDKDHTLPSTIHFHASLTSSTPVDSSRFRFYLNGQALPPTSISGTVDPINQGGLRHWTFSLNQAFPPGLNELCLRAVDAGTGDTVSTCAEFRVAAGEDFTLGEVINYPNPFETRTGFHFSLTQPADDIRVRIFTLSGRMLRELEDPSHDAGVHFLAWDGLDGDQDVLANGVYLFKVKVRAGARTLEKIGRMVKVR